MVKHGTLVLTTDPAEVAQEAAATGHHLWESNFLWGKKFVSLYISFNDRVGSFPRISVLNIQYIYRKVPLYSKQESTVP